MRGVRQAGQSAVGGVNHGYLFVLPVKLPSYHPFIYRRASRTMTNTSLWDSCLRFFENSLPSQQFNSWIKPLVFEMEGNKIILAAPNGFTLKIIQERFLPEIYKQAEAFLAFKP